ncbi:hypothetical protein TNCV_1493072 [Trichonephila clavipes]|nr:hypothetical protein TNCV_1493072 [Trichonephila clavipes]
MLGSGPYVFFRWKPDEDVDTTPLFVHSVARVTYPPYYGSGQYSITVTSPPPAPLPPVGSPPTNQMTNVRYIEEEYSSGGYIPHYGSPKTPYRFKASKTIFL